MSDSLASLYPTTTDEVRVALRLPAPRLPNPPSGARNLGSAREFYGPAMLREVQVADGDRLAFIDKAFPHSRYDVMMLVSDDEIRCAVTEVAPATKRLMLDVAASFVDYLSTPEVVREWDLGNGHLHVSFNYDRDTHDRENSMFYDKRFHLHLNYWPGRDLRDLDTVRWANITDTALRRRLIDPVADLASTVLHDKLGGKAAGWPLLTPDAERDVRLGLPFGPKLRLPGWAALRDPGFPALLDELHRAADAAYRELFECLTGHQFQPMPWYRPPVLSVGEAVANLRRLEWLSTAGLDRVARLAGLLRDVPPAQMAAFRSDERERIRRMSLGGLDYAISLFSQSRNTDRQPLAAHPETYLVLQAKLFADIGGAGLPSVDRVPLVRVDRSAGAVMTGGEIADRVGMRERFFDRYWPRLVDEHDLHIL